MVSKDGATLMTELFSLALQIQNACQDNRWPFCFIGGLAVQHWGEPRFTKDVDLTILSGFGCEEPVIDACLALYAPRIEDARSFADRTIDWHDVQGIVVRQRRNLDWSYIFRHLKPLCEVKEQPEIIERLLAIARRPPLSGEMRVAP